jgi:uncharacterized damage-inducible protein DinB
MSTPPGLDLESAVLAPWKSNCRVNDHLVQHIPAGLWSATVPGVPSRTVRAIAAHLHNARCRWINTLGREHGILGPTRVDQRTVTRHQLRAALKRSDIGIKALLELGASQGGYVPPSKGYTWRNLALDIGHVLTYFIAHEAHHRGQIVMVARQLNYRLPSSVMAGLWDWRIREPRAKRSPDAARHHD